MWSAFHEKHNFVLFNPFVNDELCVFFGDFDLLSAFACALLAEGEAGKEWKWGRPEERPAEKGAQHENSILILICGY